MSKQPARLLRTAVICILAVALSCMPAYAKSISVRLNASTKVYQKATTSSRSVKAPKNLKVTLKAYKNGWAMIRYRGRTGYVKLKYLDRCSPVKAYVKSSAAVYRYAGSGKEGTAAKGSVVYVLGINGSYAHIQNKSGSKKGYIRTSALSAKKVTSGSSSASAASAVPASLRSTTSSKGGSKVEYVIYLAQSLLGKPYADNATPPKSYDCAKLVYYCYNSAKSGSVKSSSKTQGYDSRYPRIAYDDLERGDMVCFDTVSDDDLCDHVGVYLGGGYFIHASSAAKQVILSSLKSGYYKRTFSWGRRIFSD